MKTNWLEKFKSRTLTIDDFNYHWIIIQTPDGKFSPVYFTDFFDDLLSMSEEDKNYIFLPDNFARITNLTSVFIEPQQKLSGKSFETEDQAIKYLLDNGQTYIEAGNH